MPAWDWEMKKAWCVKITRFITKIRASAGMVARIKANLEKKPKVDLKDRKILSLLTENSRMTLNQIASKVLLSRDAVRYRIQRLQKLGVIQQFVPLLDFQMFAYNRYHLFLQLEEMADAEQEKLLKEFAEHPAVVSVIEYSDNFDAEIVLLCRNVFEFDRFFTDVMNKHHDVIDDYIILERVKGYCNRLLPQEFLEFKKSQKIPEREERLKKIDETDIRILELLGEDARQSYFGIAEKVNLSSDAVSYRIKKLKKGGLIRNFSVVTNLSSIGYNWYTLLVQLRYWDSEHESKFKQMVKTHPTILLAMKCIGEWNLLIYIAAKSQTEFHHIVKGLRHDFRSVIRTYETLLGFKEHSYKSIRKNLIPLLSNDSEG